MTSTIASGPPLEGLAEFFTQWQALHPGTPDRPVEPVADAGPELAKRLRVFFGGWAEHRPASSGARQPEPLAPRLTQFFAAWQPLRPTIELEPPAPIIDWEQRTAQMKGFFQSFAPALQALAEERRQGTAINVWKAGDLRRDELRNSKVLGWLLDCRGDHGQSARILAGLLERVAPNSTVFPQPASTERPYWTRIESCPLGERESRIDIEIDGEDLLLFIEVKIDAMETKDQLDRYLTLGNAKAGRRPWGVIYLTRHGQLPSRFKEIGANSQLVAASWRDVVAVLEQQVEALPDCFARSVLRQFAEHIQSFR